MSTSVLNDEQVPTHVSSRVIEPIRGDEGGKRGVIITMGGQVNQSLGDNVTQRISIPSCNGLVVRGHMTTPVLVQKCTALGAQLTRGLVQRERLLPVRPNASDGGVNNFLPCNCGCLCLLINNGVKSSFLCQSECMFQLQSVSHLDSV